ncbi:MAG TPA: GntR family transcriptional regulator [Trebonia sp.]|nr:GntR family transcriptional regulator [Trebonia sp.]
MTVAGTPGPAPEVPSPVLHPLRGETLAVQAADAIRSLIAAGHVAGGERLVESRLAQQLGVSRGPVRDALLLLAAEGLVRDEPRRGTFVVRLTEQDVLDIYDLRIAVETAAVRLLLGRDGQSLSVLKRAIEDMRAAALDAPVTAEADLRFHGTVCELSGNSRLYEVHRRYSAELLILLRLDEEKLPHEPGATVAEHEELLEALGRGPEAAEAAFRAHLEEARLRVAAYVRAAA